MRVAGAEFHVVRGLVEYKVAIGPKAAVEIGARCTRIGLARSIRDRVSGSRSRTRAVRPDSARSRSAVARTAGSVGGMSASPSVSALRYRPVPPTITGAGLRSSSGATSRSQSPTE